MIKLLALAVIVRIESLSHQMCAPTLFLCNQGPSMIPPSLVCGHSRTYAIFYLEHLLRLDSDWVQLATVSKIPLADLGYCCITY